MGKDFARALSRPSAREAIAIIANGKETITHELITVIKASRLVIAVDEGLNLCHKYGIHPTHLVGDLDSVDKQQISAFSQLQVKKLERAKDILDLEAGIQLARQIDRSAPLLIFNACGGRKDHHLSNLYLLLKYPGTVVLTKHLAITKANHNLGIDPSWMPQQNKAIVAFYGNGSLKRGSQHIFLKAGDSLKFEAEDKTTRLIDGEMLLISKFVLDKKANQDILPLEGITFPHFDDNEDIFLLNSENRTLELTTKIGLTISLIPWLGNVKGIKTEGLKWNLKGHEMHKEFIGTSNIALGHFVKISITEGNLLCIVEKNIIDEEMVDLEDHSSTAKLMTSKL
ncbi:MAG: thiamine diphosphokinase [Chlamydiota bacterium]